MKIVVTRIKLIILLCACSYSVSAQNNIWTNVSESAMAIKHNPALALPKLYRTLRLDTATLKTALRTAPKEFSIEAKINPSIVTLPMPGGNFKSFKIVESPIMEPELATKFPDIKTYSGQGIEDPYTTVKIDWTGQGFHAMIFSQITGSVFIDPYANGSLADYISYNKKDLPSKTVIFDEGLLLNKSLLQKSANAQRTSSAPCIGGTLRQYRLAVACTSEYADSAAGTHQQATTAQALSAMVTTVNRVNGVYESELDIRLILVGNNDKIIFTNPLTQPFKGNKNANILINESQQVIDSLIGSDNYDIGHTFSTGAGGYATIGVVCDNTSKARGVTGLLHPVGDAFNIDFVAHEMGHQFGANHTFNAATGNCNGQGSSTTNAEPGSGSTIMAYAGICQAVNNLQPNSIPYFHAMSFDEITGYINTGNGSSCATPAATGNHAPSVNAGNSYVIPKSTPFALTGSASDVDGDALTYSWEEINAGGPFTDWNNPLGDAPIFRSFAPVTSPVRNFPRLTDVLNNKTTIGELLPSYARTLKFRLTARDNRSGGGGVCSAETNVTVDGNSGPFIVTAPNTATIWTVGSFNIVRWDVAKTNLAPVNCKNVNIELSIDGGLTFPITLASNTPNDGAEEISVPNNITTAARVRVVSVNNIFFNISNENFTIKSTPDLTFAFNNPLPVAACSNAIATTVINTNSINKFLTPITLSATGNPAGSTVVFSANPINPGSSVSVTLNGNIPVGIYNITITGTAGSVVASRVIQCVIGVPTKAPVNNTPVNAQIGSSLLPSFSWKPTPDARYYTLDISTSSTFASTVQRIDSIADSSYTLITPLAANTEYYWRIVPNNECGAGPVSAGFLFKTVAIVCADIIYSQNVPIIIETIKNTITSTLTIPAGGVIQDVNIVGLKGTHTYIGDLTFNLISPAGTRVELFRRICGDKKDFDLSLDDQATKDLTCPINDGQVSKPSQPLAAFNNENSTGTWKLEVADGFDVDGGSLTGWGLKICTYQPSALPVNWLTFTATKNQDKTVMLQWSTTNEINNNYYEIEKSIDGSNFNYIGKIDAGNTTAVQQYLFKDVKPYAADNFYRLKQVDKDGHFSYSKIVKVNINEADGHFIVYPNPAINKSTVRVLHETKQLTIQLADASGKLVYKSFAWSVKSGEEFEIPVKGLSKGLYILMLSTEKGTTNEKVIVQ